MKTDIAFHFEPTQAPLLLPTFEQHWARLMEKIREVEKAIKEADAISVFDAPVAAKEVGGVLIHSNGRVELVGQDGLTVLAKSEPYDRPKELRPPQKMLEYSFRFDAPVQFWNSPEFDNHW